MKKVFSGKYNKINIIPGCIYLYFIGLLLLALIIVPYLIINRNKKISTDEFYDLEPVDEKRLREAAIYLPQNIGYGREELAVNYKSKIKRDLNIISSFYSAFNGKYEDYIEQSKELLNNRYQVESSLKKLADIINNTYYLQSTNNIGENVIEIAVYHMLQLCGYFVDSRKIKSFLTSYQVARTLTYKEIYSFFEYIKNQTD